MKINGIVINQFSEEKIHSLYPDCWMIEPQGIWQLPKNKQDRRSIVCESGEYFAQEKKDGFFYSFEKRNGKGYLFGRKKSV